MSFIHFIGIDISKETFEVVCHDTPSRAHRFGNDAAGFERFLAAHGERLAETFLVLEATGGYETALLGVLLARGAAVHRADPLAAKHFIRSIGKRAKTDRLDAAALARYARERHRDLAVFRLPDAELLSLKGLIARREDVLAMRVAETNRLKHPNYAAHKASVENILATLHNEIGCIESRIDALIANSSAMRHKVAVMTGVVGVGQRTACTLIGCLPELGTLSPKKAASLAGCAPHPRDSGTLRGYRRTWGGRRTVKRCLFLAAMAARRHNPILKTFYERLIANGKKKMVALTAVMRKLVVILNAKIRDAQPATTW